MLQFIDTCKSRLDSGWAMHHPFLIKVLEDRLPIEKFRLFISHWYQMSKAHREAFPGLIANILDDDIRFDLVNILYEEFGEGDIARIHGKILERILTASGIDKGFALGLTPLKATAEFERTVKRVWLTGDHPFAYGLHFGLEYLATAQQQYFAKGMLKYEFLSSFHREYFDLHAEAEIRHVGGSENGFHTYANVEANQPRLFAGIELAEKLLGNLWDEMDVATFKEVEAFHMALT